MELSRLLDDQEDSRQTLMMFGGMALILVGAGMILTSPAVKKCLGGINLSKMLQAAAPDFERYLKLKNM